MTPARRLWRLILTAQRYWIARLGPKARGGSRSGRSLKRDYSLASATLGVMTSASLAVSTIGHGLALARRGLSKHAIKQVDRLLSNPGIDVKELFAFRRYLRANSK